MPEHVLMSEIDTNVTISDSALGRHIEGVGFSIEDRPENHPLRRGHDK